MQALDRAIPKSELIERYENCERFNWRNEGKNERIPFDIGELGLIGVSAILSIETYALGVSICCTGF